MDGMTATRRADSVIDEVLGMLLQVAVFRSSGSGDEAFSAFLPQSAAPVQKTAAQGERIAKALRNLRVELTLRDALVH